jgi:DNA-binding winged helix-turn-helix (wHTH) protein/tetratricopeptide (TPR) repeat protein
MTPPQIVTFGPFEFDGQSGELRKCGLKIRLADQPQRVLRLLLRQPGDVVSRDEIQQELWPEGTFVDFDAGLSSAVRKLREALGDTAGRPRFIETLPRRGYRFVAPVTTAAPVTTPAATAPSAPAPSPARSTSTHISWTAAAVAVALLLVVVAHTWSAPRVSAPANTAFLKGVLAEGQENMAGFRTAVAYFEEATTKQPDFAMAYARLGEAQLQLVYSGQLAPRDTIPRADAAIRKALAIDDTIPLAHRMRGAILHNYYWDWASGNREIQRAIELDGTSVDAHTQMALALARSARFDEALAEAERARALDSLSARAALTVGTVLRATAQYDRALAEFQKTVQLNPQMARGHFHLGVTYALMRRWPAATEALERAVALSPDNGRFLAYVGLAYAKAGRTADARRVLGQLSVRARTQYVSSFGIASIADALEEREAALTAFERAVDEHAIEFSLWNQYPPVQSVGAEPRYQAVMHHVLRNP